MLDKKPIQVIFLFKFKMGHKQRRHLATSTTHLALEILTKHTLWWWFKKFCKGAKNLEDEEPRDRPSEVDNNQLRASSKLTLLQLTQQSAKNLNVDHSTVIQHLKQIGKLKSSISGCLMSQPQVKKITVLKCCLLLFYNNKPFLDQIVTCDEKWILYDNQRQPAQWLDCEEASKHFSKPNLHQKKLSLVGGLMLAGPLHYSFLNPGKTITSKKYAQQMDVLKTEMHAAGTGQQKWPNSSP